MKGVMEQWIPLGDFPGYSASNFGRVRNDRRDSLLSAVLTQSRPYVGLVCNGVQVKRSLSKLICETFVPRPANPLFETPIHLDGDLINCHAENLLWRPRWFALKHLEQFRRRMPDHEWPIREIKTREEFSDCWGPVFHYGLLYVDVVLAVINKTYVFPTMQIFERIT